MKNNQNQPMQFIYDVPFTMIESKILTSEYLTVYEKAVYCVLCAHANNNDKSCYPSYNTIAKETNCSRSKSVEVIAELERIGLVKKQEQFNKKGENISNLYYINTYTQSVVDNLLERVGKPDLGSPPQTLPSPQELPPSPPHGLRSPQGVPELYSFNYNHFNYNQSVCQSAKGQDGQTELHKIIETLKAETEYEYFELEMPDKIPFIDSLLTYIAELKIEDEPQNRKLLSDVNSLIIMGFLEHIKTKSSARVKNKKAYFKKMFIEYLREDQILLATAH